MPPFGARARRASSTAVARKLRLRRVGHPGENVGEPSLRIDVIELYGLDERVYQGRPFRPALGTSKQPRLPAQGQAAHRALGGVVRETDAAVMEESGEGSPAREHVVDRLGTRGMAREFGARGAHPVFQPSDQGGALFAPRAQPLLSGQSIDLALDVQRASMR